MIRVLHKAIFWVTASAAIWPLHGNADDLLTFIDQQQFLKATASHQVTGPYTLAGTGLAQYNNGPIQFQAAGSSSINLGQWTPRLDGVDIALNGYEELDVSSNVPVYAMGIQFDDGGVSTSDSRFRILAYLGADLVGSGYEFLTPQNGLEINFIGIWAPEPFDRLEIREISDVNENEFFGQVFTGQVPTGENRKVKRNHPYYAGVGWSVAIHGTNALVSHGWVKSQKGSPRFLARITDGSWALGAHVPYPIPSGAETGYAMALSSDAVVIGSPGDSETADESGAVWSTRKNGPATWSAPVKFKAEYPSAGDRVGQALAMDGDIVLIGAPRAGQDDGAVAVAELMQDGSLELLVGLPLALEGENARHGHAVAIDLPIMVTSAPGLSRPDGKGVVQIFEIESENGPESVTLLKPSANPLREFGESVALYGHTLVVGAPVGLDSGGPVGAVYVFDRKGSGQWAQRQVLTGSLGEENFGEHVAIHAHRMLVSATFSQAGKGPGSVYYYEREGNSWKLVSRITAADATKGDRFGCSIALFANQALIGACGDDDFADSRKAGAIYAVRLDRLFEMQGGIFRSDFEATEPD